jgi:hypothetical protein
LELSYVDIDAAREMGFQDGFQGNSARGVSDFIDQQNAYFKAFREGREHRGHVEEMVKDMGVKHNILLFTIIEYYYEKVFKTKSTKR